jgi:hypothetical protein
MKIKQYFVLMSLASLFLVFLIFLITRPHKASPPPKCETYTKADWLDNSIPYRCNEVIKFYDIEYVYLNK